MTMLEGDISAGAVQARLRLPWSYAVVSVTRDLRLDFLRGYALLAMIINHFGGTSWLYALSGHEAFYTSAAEAFYVISGLVLGVVAARQPLGNAVRRVLRRAFVLYCVAVTMALGFTALGVLTDLRLWYDVQQELPRGLRLREFVVGILTLHESFHGAQILVLYVIYMLAAPLALLACAERKGWLVLLVSALIYLISQFQPEAVSLPFAVYPSIAAWQPLFFCGLVIGYYRDWLRNVAGRWPRRGMVEICIVLVALFFLWIHVGDYAAWPALPELLGEREQHMSIFRLALVALYFQAFYLLVTWLWVPLYRLAGWLLLPLGQSSLWTFVTHLVVIVLFYNLPIYDRESHALIGTAWQCLAILTIWATVKLHDMFTGLDQKPIAFS